MIKIKAYEIVSEIHKKEPSAAESDIYKILTDAEAVIAPRKGKEFTAVESGESELILDSKHRNVYIEFVIKELAKNRDDWDCYNLHNALYTAALTECLTVRSEGSFKNEWRW